MGGAKDVKVTHEECVSRGGSRYSFRVTYKPD